MNDRPAPLARTYVGRFTGRLHDATTQEIVVVWPTGAEYDVRRHPMRHGSGVAWGYAGSGPAEAARQILWDFLDDEPTPSCYQAFKQERIAPRSQSMEWTMPSADVAAWLDEWRAQHPGAPMTVRAAEDAAEAEWAEEEAATAATVAAESWPVDQ